MDSLGPHRAVLMASLEKAMRQAEQHAKAESIGQTDLFGVLMTDADNSTIEHEFIQVPPWPEAIWLEGERETLGLYLTGHPIDRYRNELKHYVPAVLAEVKPTERDQVTTVAGLVVDVRTMLNRQNQRWAIVTLHDKTARFDVRFFAKDYETYQDLLEKDQILVVKGEVSFDDYSAANTMTAREVMTIIGMREQYAKTLRITVRQEQIEGQGLTALQQLIEPFKQGACPLHIRYVRPDLEADYVAATEWYVTPTDELLYELQQRLGKQAVELEF